MLRRMIMITVLIAFTICRARADPGISEDFKSAIGAVMGGLRSAASYVRTGNIALAQAELADAGSAWRRLRSPVAASSSPYRQAALDAFLDEGDRHLAAADRALEASDDAQARLELQSLRRSFYDLRRGAHLYDLGDCVFELAAVMEALRVAATRFNDGKLPATAEETEAAATSFGNHLRRCNDLASSEVATQPEFRRLIDGATASAREIGRAALAGDRPLVHRYLIELQSFAQLLDFRFG
jgi:hypothetical protein